MGRYCMEVRPVRHADPSGMVSTGNVRIDSGSMSALRRKQPTAHDGGCRPEADITYLTNVARLASNNARPTFSSVLDWTAAYCQ